MLELTGVRVCFEGAEVLRGIDLRVGDGEVVALLGANGAGKSTLLRAISGLIPGVEGSLRFAGEELYALAAHEVVGRGIAQATEEKHLFPRSSVRENLLLGAYTRRKYRDEVRASLDEVCELFPILAERSRQSAGTLSGGEQRMLAIGRAMMSRPRLLLLDEPGLGLAPRVFDEVFASIDRIHERGTAVLLAEQNAHAALGAARRGYVLENGAVVLEGTAAELREDPGVRDAYLGG